jgi:hypothetical protein
MNHREYVVETYYYVPLCSCGADLTVRAGSGVLASDPPKAGYVCGSCGETTLVPEQQWPGMKYRTTGELCRTQPVLPAAPAPVTGSAPGDSHTYDEWMELGYHVMRGEKSLERNSKGIPVFSTDQVEEDEDYP